MKYLAVIPARYASSRFPGKPLAKLGGKEVIIRVAEQVEKSGIETIVATDDERIANCVESAGYRVVMTRNDHKSGTDRICEAVEKCHTDADIIINVQGDEPFIHPSQIRELQNCFDDHQADIATLARPFDRSLGFDALRDPNVVKVVFSQHCDALYFSRSIIPYIRNKKCSKWTDNYQYYTHIGVYAYRRNVLCAITRLPQSPLESAESLEQLRWLEAGYRIRVGISDCETIGIDTPADLEAAELYLRRKAADSLR